MSIRVIVRVAMLCVSALVAVSPGSVLALDYARLYAAVSPSVVTVNTQTIKLSESGISTVPGIGTGFLVDSDLVMTAAHVVKGVDLIRVRFNDETYIGAEVVAIVSQNDVALLKLDTPRPDAVVAKLGDSDAAMTGSPVFVVGAPFGFEQTLSVGYLSGRTNRGKSPDGSPAEFLQTDTAINPGNSGGPMFNERGEVIGVVSFILTKSGGFDGIGFASAITAAYKTLMESTGTVAGFEGLALTKLQTRVLNVPGDGVLIQRVVKGSAADELGLKAGSIPVTIAEQKLLLGGDVVLAVECTGCVETGKRISVSDIASKLTDELSVAVKIFRDGQVMILGRPVNRDSESLINAMASPGNDPATGPIADAGLSMLYPR